MAVISESLGYLYIMAPRTACTATGVHLCKTYEGEWLPPDDIVDDEGVIRVQRKHSTRAQLLGHELLTPEQAADLFTFTAVRNPFDSLLSLWFKKRTSYQEAADDPSSFVWKVPGFADDLAWVLDHDFSEWIERTYRPLDDGEPHHLYGGFVDDADLVMRFETLQDDFGDALRQVGVPNAEPIPVLNETEGRDGDYRPYYSAEARRLIERVFAADLEVFGYRFDGGSVSLAEVSLPEARDRARRAERELAESRLAHRTGLQRAERELERQRADLERLREDLEQQRTAYQRIVNDRWWRRLQAVRRRVRPLLALVDPRRRRSRS